MVGPWGLCPLGKFSEFMSLPEAQQENAASWGYKSKVTNATGLHDCQGQTSVCYSHQTRLQ